MPSTRLNAVARLYGYGLPHSHSSSTLEEEEEDGGGGGGGINISSLPSSSPRTRLAQKQKAMLQASQIQEELLASVNAIKGPRNQTNFCMLCGRRNLRDFGCPGRNCTRYACWENEHEQEEAAENNEDDGEHDQEEQSDDAENKQDGSAPQHASVSFLASVHDAAAAARSGQATKMKANTTTSLVVPLRKLRAVLDFGAAAYHATVVPFQAAFLGTCHDDILSPVPLIGVATTTFLVFTTIVETMYIANLRLNLLDQVRDAVDAGFYIREADGTRRRIAHDAGKERRETILAFVTPRAVLARLVRAAAAISAWALASFDAFDSGCADERNAALMRVLRCVLCFAAVSGVDGAIARRAVDKSARAWLTTRLGADAPLAADLLSHAFAFLISAHAVACAWGVVARLPPAHETTWLRQIDDGPWGAYAYASHWAVSTLVTAGTAEGPAAANTAAEQGVAAIASLLGAASAASLIARICVLFAAADAPASRERALLASLRSTLGSAAARENAAMRDKLLAYFAFRHDSGFDSSEAARRALASAPPGLRAAAMLAAEPWITSTALLHEGTGAFHLRVAGLLDRMLCPPGEEVFIENAPQPSVYLVRSGLVAVAGGAYASRLHAFGLESLLVNTSSMAKNRSTISAVYAARTVTYADLLHCKASDVLAAAADQPPRVLASLRRSGLFVLARAEVLAYARACRLREGGSAAAKHSGEVIGPYMRMRTEHYLHRLASVYGSMESNADLALRRMQACLLVQRRVRRFIENKRRLRKDENVPASREQLVTLSEDLDARLRRVEASVRAASAALEAQRARQEILLDSLASRVEEASVAISMSQHSAAAGAAVDTTSA